MIPATPGFLQPELLWLLAALPLLGVFLHRAERSRAAVLVLLGLGEPARRTRGWVPPLVVTALLLLALARPYLGFEDRTTPAPGRDVVVGVDVSISMLTRDESPNRLEFARRKVLDIIDLLATRSPGDRIGLVVFSADAHLFLPLTADYPVARMFARALSADLVTAGGSSLTAGIDRALSALTGADARAPRVILITDGEDATGTAASSASRAREAGIPVALLGVGSGEGRPIELERGRFVRDSRGNTVVSRLDDARLRTIAELTGGVYREASLGDSDISALLWPPGAGTASGEGSRQVTIRTYREIGPLLLWPILGFLLLHAIRGGATPALSLILGLWFVSSLLPASLRAETGSATLHDGWRAYEEGRYEEAREIFAGYLQRNPDDLKVQKALGGAHYRLKEYKEAERSFGQVRAAAKSGRDLYEGSFNEGNARLMGGRPAEAISSYEEALRVKPGDEAATYNLELARKLLEKKSAEPPPPAESEESQQGKQEQQEKDSRNESNTEEQSEGDRESEAESEAGGDPAPSPSPADASPPAQGAPEESPRDESAEGAPEGTKTEPEAHPSPAETATPGPGEAGEREETSPQPENDEPKSAPEELPTPSDQDEPDSERENAEPQPGGSGSEGGTTEQPEDGSGQTPASETPSPGRAPPPSSPRELREAEARAWLESLNDRPVLLRPRDRRQPARGEQFW